MEFTVVIITKGHRLTSHSQRIFPEKRRCLKLFAGQCSIVLGRALSDCEENSFTKIPE